MSLAFISQAGPKRQRSRLQDVSAPSQDHKNSNDSETEEAEESDGNILYFYTTNKSLGDEMFTVLKDWIEKTTICTLSSRWVRVKIPEQYKVEYGSAVAAIGADLTQEVMICQHLLKNVKDRDISTDGSIVRGDFSEAELEGDVSAQQLGIMGRKHIIMMRTIQQMAIDPTDEALQSVCFHVN